MESKHSLWSSQSTMVSLRTVCGRFCVPRILATVIGTATFITLAASTVFTVLNAIAWAPVPVVFRGAATAASVFDVLAILSLFLAFVSGTCSWDVKRLPNNCFWRFVPALCITIAIIAICLTVRTSILKSQNDDLLGKNSLPVWTAPSSAEYAVWASAMVFQIAFYSIILLARLKRCTSRAHTTTSSPRSQRSTRDPKSISAATGDTESTMQMSLTIMPPQSTRSSVGHIYLPSPTYSYHSSSSPRRSWRESLHQAVRPITSKTKLIRTTPSVNASFVASDARSFDSSTPRHSDAFDAWDTSDVDPGFKESVIHGGATAVPRSHAAQKVTAPQPRGSTPLPTIPGSRPVSQADVLDNPFHTQLEENPPSTTSTEIDNYKSTQQGTNTPRKLSTTQSQPSRSNFSSTSVPYALSTSNLPPPPPIRTNSRPTSPSLHSSPLDPHPYDLTDLPTPDESFIHPLFRSESPTPPPRATPGTSITGSHFPGTIISPPRAPSRMRSASPAPSLSSDLPPHASTTSLPPADSPLHQHTRDSQIATPEPFQPRSRSASRTSSYSTSTYPDTPLWHGQRRPSSRAIVGVGLPHPPNIGRKMSNETVWSGVTGAVGLGMGTPHSPVRTKNSASSMQGAGTATTISAGRKGSETSPGRRKGSRGAIEEKEGEKAEPLVMSGQTSKSGSRAGSVRTQQSARERDEGAAIPGFVLQARAERMG
ncbi:hypothetical protein P152DRAFT_139150 [Eremomyces bilateralis CBS 781.70]|uniref:Uncharacterized protein n=1 Tax=Eremomyces bilateralis CBS 781.70 TaxID=1392243 RepID=A0A6G1FWL1_9PEZI|nr:uncharacterized protein P152DRAFT_139150 [Eremomyces bilateralis CBS 781.70]KAF1810076.1 hypothetical protein P152DRAFT_139150 [Eremomyces bilateralis CBS 781.70]